MAVSMMTLTSASWLHGTCPRLPLRISPVPGAGTVLQARVRRISPIACVGEQTGSEGVHSDPPKLEPFSQSRLTRAMRERNFLQKAEDALNEKCMVLEGEEAYECWEALFDYEKMKEEAEAECSIEQPGERDGACQSLQRFESMVRQSGGVNSLIGNVRMVAKIKEANKEKAAAPNEQDWLKAVSAVEEEAEKPEHEFTEDGGIPKSTEKLKEEMEAMMPESPFTRILRAITHSDQPTV